MNYKELENLLIDNHINFIIPSKGCYKIITGKYITLMFYPKSGTLIWKGTKKDFQHKYTNPIMDNVINKLKSLL